MGYKKTAISIQETLFEKAEELARDMKISRSRLFVIAVEDFIQRHQNRKLLDQINSAYEDEPDPVEKRRLLSVRRMQHKNLEGEW